MWWGILRLIMGKLNWCAYDCAILNYFIYENKQISYLHDSKIYITKGNIYNCVVVFWLARKSCLIAYVHVGAQHWCPWLQSQIWRTRLSLAMWAMHATVYLYSVHPFYVKNSLNINHGTKFWSLYVSKVVGSKICL